MMTNQMLQNKRIAILVENGFEQEELTRPEMRLKRPEPKHTLSRLPGKRSRAGITLTGVMNSTWM